MNLTPDTFFLQQHPPSQEEEGGGGGQDHHHHHLPPPSSSHFRHSHHLSTSTSSSSPSPSSPRGPVPKFYKSKSPSDLNPHRNNQPLFRRANPEGGFISPLQALTTHLPATYRICNPVFKYESSRNPRRVLTKPSKGVKNDGYDNEDSDYILYVNDILGSEEANHKNRYLILDVLGQGTFGQVVKCQNLRTQEVVAVKVVKNKTAYFNQSMMEVSVLDLINKKLDKTDDHHLLRLKDTFIHKQHLCLVLELLSVNLYELIKQNQFRGLSTTLVRVFAQQLLNGLSLLNKARLIHCDLKPENILLKNLESPIIKIIDFGSACDERQTVYTYIQSRFYRSPEVLLGLPYSSGIDMWSLGCIVVELFLGLPLFPGSSEYNQVSRITEMLGLPPAWMLESGKQAPEFFEKLQDEYGRVTWRLKSMEQYSREHNTREQPSKKYFQATTLSDIIRSYPMPRKNMKPPEVEREMNNRIAFIDFVRGLLTINPLERWTPQQAKLHPFITQAKYTGPFRPPQSNLAKSLAPGVQQQQAAEAAYNQRMMHAQVQVHAHAQAAQAQAQAQAQAHAQAQANQYALMSAGYTPPAAAAAAAAAAYGNMYQPGRQLGGGAAAAAATGSPAYTLPPTSSQQQQHQQPPTAQIPMPPSQYTHQPPPTAAQSATAAAQQQQQQQQQQQSYTNPAAQIHHLPIHPHPSSISSTTTSTSTTTAAAAAAPPPTTHHDSLFAQATARASRQRATTMEQQQSGIPPAIQRVASRLDPNAPIRLQPSPAYYPPPAEAYGQDVGLAGPSASSASQAGGRRRSQRFGGGRVGIGMSAFNGGGGGMGGGGSGRGSNGQGRDFIRNLEDGAMGGGWRNMGGWH